MTIFYGIDMGVPGVGFAAWRWDSGLRRVELFYGRADAWQKCSQSIADDHRKAADVVVAIEAPLWGRRNAEGRWQPRFKLELWGNEYSEWPWYCGAGAATALMAQEFLHEIARLISEVGVPGPRKIRLRETYISGLCGKARKDKTKVRHIQKTVLKATSARDGAKRGKARFESDHAIDAFESLLIAVWRDADPCAFPSTPEFESADLREVISTHFKFDRNELKTSRPDTVDLAENERFPLGVLMAPDGPFDLLPGIQLPMREWKEPI